MGGGRRGLSSMAALLLCAAMALVAHGDRWDVDEKKLTSSSSSFNPQQLTVKPDPGFYDCIAAFPRLASCAGDIWNTITNKQPRIGPTCCKVFGGIQYECVYRALVALNIEVIGLDVWTDMLRSGCTQFKFYPHLPP